MQLRPIDMQKYTEKRQVLLKSISSSAGDFLTQSETMKLRQMRYYREICLSEIKYYRYSLGYVKDKPELKEKEVLFRELVRLRKKESVIVAKLIEDRDYLGFVRAITKFARRAGVISEGIHQNSLTPS